MDILENRDILRKAGAGRHTDRWKACLPQSAEGGGGLWTLAGHNGAQTWRDRQSLADIWVTLRCSLRCFVFSSLRASESMFLLRFPCDSDVGTAWDSFSYPWSPSLPTTTTLTRAWTSTRTGEGRRKKKIFLKNFFLLSREMLFRI